MKYDIIGNDIYKVLSAPTYEFEITMYDELGQGTIDPSKTKWFYAKPENIMIEMPERSEYAHPEVNFWKSGETMSECVQEVIERIKKNINKYGFGLTVYDLTGDNVPKQFSHIAMRDVEKTKDEMYECYTGSAYRSYYKLPKAKIIIVHSERVNEDTEEARTSNIKDVFVNFNGEKRRLPSKNLDGARAIAIHLNNGGKFGDKFCKTVIKKMIDLDKFNELCNTIDNDSYQYGVVDKYKALVESDLQSVSSTEGYDEYSANILSEPTIGKHYLTPFGKRLSHSDIGEYGYDRLVYYIIKDEMKKMQSYIDIIKNNVYDELDNVDLQHLAKMIICQCVPFNEDKLIEPDTVLDPIKKVLILGGNICINVDDDMIREAVGNIISKDEISNEEALFILAIVKSCLHYPKLEVLAQDEEMQNFNSWVTKNSYE